MNLRDFWDDNEDWITGIGIGLVVILFIYFIVKPSRVEPTTGQEEVLMIREDKFTMIDNTLSSFIEKCCQDGKDSIVVPIDSLIMLKECLETLVENERVLDSLWQNSIDYARQEGWVIGSSH